jgi:transcriptional regulator with XRE-family HTH domain
MKLDETKLLNARLDKGLTQEAVAEKAGVSFATYNRAENGKGVHPPSALAIAKALGLDLADLRLHDEAADEDGDAA